MRERFPDARFRIIGAALFGESEYEERVRSLVREMGLQDVVEFCGFRDDVRQAMSELDILAHTSVTGEPFGLVIAEGMAAGKPVVATKGGGVPEVVEDQISGLLVPPRDADALAAAICHLLDNPAEARAMGERGRIRIGKYFTTSNTARKVEHFYETILDRDRPSGQSCEWQRSVEHQQGRGFRISLAGLVAAWIALFAEITYSVIEVVNAGGDLST